MIAPSVEQQVAILHIRLNEAFERISQLEQENRDFRSGLQSSPTNPILEQYSAVQAPKLVPLDSPEMEYALQLCQEVYPGCQATPQLMADPDEPARTWYSLKILWKGDPRGMSAKDREWYRRFEAKYPQAANDFCLSSQPE